MVEKQISHHKNCVEVSIKYGKRTSGGGMENREGVLGYFNGPAIEVLGFCGRIAMIRRYKSITLPLGPIRFEQKGGAFSKKELIVPKWGIEIDELEKFPYPGISSLRSLGSEKNDNYLIYGGLSYGPNGSNIDRWLSEFGAVLSLNLELNQEDRLKFGLQNYLDLSKEQMSFGDNWETKNKLESLLEVAALVGIKNPKKEDLKRILENYRKNNWQPKHQKSSSYIPPASSLSSIIGDVVPGGRRDQRTGFVTRND